MSYRDYLRWEGGCSIALGLALAALALPGLLVSHRAWWIGLLFVPAALLALAAWAASRRGAAPWRPGDWLTARPLASATPGRAPLPAAALRRRLVIETALWIAGSALWLSLAGSSGLLFFGTGLASVAFGTVQAFAAAPRVEREERRRGARYLVARRPGLGTPELTTA